MHSKKVIRSYSCLQIRLLGEKLDLLFRDKVWRASEVKRTNHFPKNTCYKKQKPIIEMTVVQIGRQTPGLFRTVEQQPVLSSASPLAAFPSAVLLRIETLCMLPYDLCVFSGGPRKSNKKEWWIYLVNLLVAENCLNMSCGCCEFVLIELPKTIHKNLIK